MRHRRSPHRHTVRGHTRQNHHVNSYTRGKGEKTQIASTSRRSQIRSARQTERMGKPKPFTVNFVYSKKKGDGESVIVISTSYKKALDEAYEEKVDKRNPISVEVVDPDFGRVFKAIGSAAKKAGKLGAHAAVVGAKYSWRGAEVFGKAAGEAISERLDSYEERLRAKKLIRESYAVDRAKRIMAKAKLKKEFPEIYKLCDFSKERSVRY